MRRRWFLELLLVLAAVALARPALCAPIGNWLCYYGAECTVADYQRFDLAVLDGVKHPPLKHTAPGRPLLLGYVSVGEERPGGPAWVLVQHQNFVAGKNKNWGSYVIDMRSQKWQSILLDIIIPKVLAQGFDGVFLDTIDSALALAEGKDKAKYTYMRAHVLAFLGKLRQRFPGIYIAMNRGLELMPAAAPLIDFLLIEDLSYEYDFETKTYRPVKPEVQKQLVDAAVRGQVANPRLTVLTLDYAKPDQQDAIRQSIEYSRSKGFVPYVSTVELDKVFFHTLAR